MSRVKSGVHQPPNRKHQLRLVLLAFFICAMFVLVYLIGSSLENQQHVQPRGDLSERFEQPTVVYQGKTYRKNAALKTILFLGIDSSENRVPSTVYVARNGGQCDFLMLLVIDSQQKTVKSIQIDRDTMAEINVLGVLGNDLGTNTHQICLAHGFGNGGKQSCELTVLAVQRLLYGAPVDEYYALNLDAIPILNDILGGVTVTLEDDFSAYDASMTPGKTITLQGKQAELFVRSRLLVGDGTNASRMKRQQLFLETAIDDIKARLHQDAAIAEALFDGLTPYVVTSMSRGKTINTANKVSTYQMEPILMINGVHTVGTDGFIEFHTNEDAVLQLVLDVFYIVQP